MRMIARLFAALFACAFAAEAHAGLNTSCAQWPGSQPTAAATNHFNCLRFSDHFQNSSIDGSDTGAAGFNWYTHNAFPLANSGIHWSTLAAGTATPSNEYSVSGGALTISSAALYGLFPGGTYGVVESLNTCRSNGAGGYVGKAFGPALYAEINASYAAQPAGFNSAAQFWPIAWMVPSQALVTSTPGHFVETDVFEAPFGEQLHDWNGSVAGDDHAFGPGSVGAMPVAILNLPASLNPNGDGGLTGKFQRYGNGTADATATVIYGSGVAPTGGGSSLGFPTGTYAPLNTNQMCIILSGWGGANSWPGSFTAVDVWTP